MEGPQPDKIAGYRVLRRVATGSTSDVLLARAEGPHGFERVVVLKLLLSSLDDDPSFAKAFAREAAAYARLSHPAIVKLYDFFASGEKLVMVLEYVDGLPLSKLRAVLQRAGVPLGDDAAIHVAWRIFSALAAAHSARDAQSGEFAPVIHRDINPSNVLIPWDGHVKIADFGMAKVTGLQSDTKAGFIKGTYGYMAPEQVKGDSVTVRADVYAASLLLWELLTRKKAFQRGALSEVEFMRTIADPHIVPLDALRPDLTPALRNAIGRGLEPVADRRSMSAEEMAAILRMVCEPEKGRAALVEAISRARPATEDELSTTVTIKGSGLPKDPKTRDKMPTRTGEALSESDVDEVTDLEFIQAPATPPPVPRVSMPPPLPRVSVPPPLPSPRPKAATTLPPLPPETSIPAPSIPAEGVTPNSQDVTQMIPRMSNVETGQKLQDEVLEVKREEPVVAQSDPRPVRSRWTAPAIAGACAIAILAVLAWRAHKQGGNSAPGVEHVPFVEGSSSGTTTLTMSSAPPSSAAQSATPGKGVAPAPSSRPSLPGDASGVPVATASTATTTATPATSGDIKPPSAAAGHRVFVDGHVAGEGRDPIRVRCGEHTVQVGSSGKPQTVTVPCGGEVTVE